MVFSIKSMVNVKEAEPEPEPQFVISALALAGNLISAPRLRLRNTGFTVVYLSTHKQRSARTCMSAACHQKVRTVRQ
jgi:hypothetical protein